MAAIGLISFSDCNDSDGLACPPLSDMGIYWHHHWPTTVTRTCSHVASEKHWSQSTGYSSHSSCPCLIPPQQIQLSFHLRNSLKDSGPTLQDPVWRVWEGGGTNHWLQTLGPHKDKSKVRALSQSRDVTLRWGLWPSWHLGMVITPVGWRWWLMVDGSISSICRFSLIYVGNIYCLYPTCQVIK